MSIIKANEIHHTIITNLLQPKVIVIITYGTYHNQYTQNKHYNDNHGNHNFKHRLVYFSETRVFKLRDPYGRKENYSEIMIAQD